MIRGRRRAIGLAILAVAVPLPAFALSGAVTSGGPATLSVSSSLRSCGVLHTEVVCQIAVSFNPIDNATSYAASVTRSDGSVVDSGAVSPGGSTLYVNYVGAGTYTVRVTAYGVPEAEQQGSEPIATAVARTEPVRSGEHADQVKAEPETAHVQASGRRAASEAVAAAPADGVNQVEASPVCEPADASQAPSEPLPEPPPEDLDPENPDEDDDGVDDVDEQTAYERAVAAEQAAAARAATVAHSPGCP